MFVQSLEFIDNPAFYGVVSNPTMRDMESASQTVTIPDAIKLALRHHQSGELAQAESIYRQVLAVEPDHPDALQLLGVIANQAGQPEAAIELIGKSIRLFPNNPYGYNNLGEAYRALKRFDEAIEAYQQALGLLPIFPEAYNNLGNARKTLGQRREAEVCYRKALEIRPEYAEAYNNLGNLFKDDGDWEQAIACYRKALSLKSDYPEAWCNLGNVFQDMDRFDEAIVAYQAALATQGNYAVAHNNLGGVLLRLKRYQDAAQCFSNALKAKANYADAQLNLGNVFKETGQLDEAVSCYQRALAIEPDHGGVYNNLGNVYKEQGRHETAIQAYREALRLKPDFPVAQWNLSLELLLIGNYAEGFSCYECRFSGGDKEDFALGNAMLSWLAPLPRWQGEDLQGRTLLVWTEQGQGDSLMMMRYLPLLAGRGVGSLKVYCEPALVRLFQAQPCVEQAIGRDITPSLDGIDVHVPMLSLPYLFDTRLETIPVEFPYLEVPVSLTQDWAEKFVGESRLKVGLVWAGGKALRYDAKRSLNLDQFAPIMQTPGVVFYSLQKGESAQQLAASNWPVTDWMDECQDFLDTSALVQQLDLVISVDTAVAHLAGALGKPVWLLNRFESEWRWMLEREDSPWYPGLRQFRQTAPGDWESVVAPIANELAKQTAGYFPK